MNISNSVLKCAGKTLAVTFMMFAVASGYAAAQQITLTMDSAGILAGSSVGLNLTLTSSGGAMPAAVQWTMSYPSSVVSTVSVSPSAALTAAGKSVTCSSQATSTTCIVYGLNATVIPDGVIATAVINVSAAAPPGVAPIPLSAVSGSTASGTPIAGATQSGALTVTQPTLPTLTGLSCAPSTITSPGSSTCTVSLNLAALSALGVTLSSNNANVTVQGLVTIPIGGISIGFTATAASVTTAQTATISAVAGGVTKTFSLTIQPSPTWSISGTLTSAGSGATVSLTGTKSATTTADASGNYSFAGLQNGSYTVSPSKNGVSFTPANQTVTMNGANITVNFSVPTQTWSISGNLSSSGSGATVSLTGAKSATTPADASGNYTFIGLQNGSYTVSPSKNGVSFAPANQTVTVNGANVTANFATQTQTWSISGTLTSAGSGATVSLTGAKSATTTADASGNYSFAALQNGSYTVSPSKSGVSFTPANQTVTINGANMTVNFAVPTQTWNISGTLTTGGSGATLTLSGTITATTIANGTGGYTFTGVPNGTYTLTPSKGGVSFSPTSQSLTIAGADKNNVNFAVQTQTWTLSGTIAGGSGATVALSNGASATADSTGKYQFTGVGNGTYTVTPTETGFTMSPLSQSVTVNGANATVPNFTATQNAVPSTITIDTQVRTDQSNRVSSVTSPGFSTSSGKELLLAFVSADYRSGFNTVVNSVTGAGLTWSPVVTTRTQRGTAEIWRAFATSPLSNVSVTANLSQKVTSSITVMSFAGVDPSGTNGSGAIGAVGHNSGSSGAPSVSLVTTRNNSFVVGVGEDPSDNLSRTPGSGQTLVHQFLAPSATYWVQTRSGATPSSGTTVTINDSSPTSDPFNLSIAEILAAPAGTTSVSSFSMSERANVEAVKDIVSDASVILTDLAGRPVTNACSPGAVATLNGAGFGVDSSQARVNVNDAAAQLLSVADSQITFVCPSLAAGAPLSISVAGPDGLARSAASSTMREALPELFTVDGTNQGVVLLGATNEIAMPSSDRVAGRPAHPGESITLYASGLGAATGQVRVVVGGIAIDASIGAAPAAGLSQIDLRLPASVLSGPAVPLYVELALSDGSVAQSNEVTLAIGE